jgi:hypothetical protein
VPESVNYAFESKMELLLGILVKLGCVTLLIFTNQNNIRNNVKDL